MNVFGLRPEISSSITLVFSDLIDAPHYNCSTLVFGNSASNRCRTPCVHSPLSSKHLPPWNTRSLTDNVGHSQGKAYTTFYNFVWANWHLHLYSSETSIENLCIFCVCCNHEGHTIALIVRQFKYYVYNIKTWRQGKYNILVYRKLFYFIFPGKSIGYIFTV